MIGDHDPISPTLPTDTSPNEIFFPFISISGTDMADFEDEKDKGKKDDHDSGPEEEEVPTRGFLKRQANMIVDAKSRSKRGTRRR